MSDLERYHDLIHGQREEPFKYLGKGPIPPGDTLTAELESIPMPASQTVTLTIENVQTFCPVTRQPDFGKLVICYHGPNTVETKSLKVYLGTLMWECNADFVEVITHNIAQAIFDAIDPLWVTITSDWATRGGISIRVDTIVEEEPVE